MSRRIHCVLMRAGTSRGPFVLADDLPTNPAGRDAVLMRIMGSPDLLQLDGLGGGKSITSKVAIVSPSYQPGADVDYLFAQVKVHEARVDMKPNCGNMLSGVGPFAIDAGLVAARDPETVVRIFNANTRTLVEAVVQTPGGRVRYEGDTRIDGVAEPAAPVKLTFLDATGAMTGSLLPTGRVVDVIDGVEVSCIDLAMPVVIMAAEAFGKSGAETPEELEADRALFARIAAIRLQAGSMMGQGDVSRAVVPKPVLVSRARNGGSITSRYFTPLTCHRSQRRNRRARRRNGRRDARKHRHPLCRSVNARCETDPRRTPGGPHRGGSRVEWPARASDRAPSLARPHGPPNLRRPCPRAGGAVLRNGHPFLKEELS